MTFLRILQRLNVHHPDIGGVELNCAADRRITSEYREARCKRDTGQSYGMNSVVRSKCIKTTPSGKA